jgi:hypothetical protein
LILLGLGTAQIGLCSNPNTKIRCVLRRFWILAAYAFDCANLLLTNKKHNYFFPRKEEKKNMPA